MSTKISKLTLLAAALFTCAVLTGCTGNALEETESMAPSGEGSESDAVDDEGVKEADGAKEAGGAKEADHGDETPDGYHEE